MEQIKKLEEAYDAEKFRKMGHELVDLMADYLTDAQQEKLPVIAWKEAGEQVNYWENYKLGAANPMQLFQDILDRSIHLHHPKYIGHQIAPTVPVAALAGLLSAFLNNGMAIYEMGAAATAIEQLVVKEVTQHIGFDAQADGFLTSGGTLANLTALLAARSAVVAKDIWEEGHTEQLAVMVSAEAHYCVDRALRIMGFGAAGIIKIPVGADYRMRTDLLESYLLKAQASGKQVIAVVGSAPSTSTGVYDDLAAIAAFCVEHKLWFHVDGAHGGAAIYSPKYQSLVKGIEQADSVVIDGHKMMMMPSTMTFLLFKNSQHSYGTFRQKAHYLLGQSAEEEWYNLATRTFECTKEMMSIQFFVLLQMYGSSIFDEFVTHLYDLGKQFAQKIKARAKFELLLEPDSNIVCFRYFETGRSLEDLNKINRNIRQSILAKGDFYIVQTTLKDTVYLRTTFMNPKTNDRVMEELLNVVERGGNCERNQIETLL